MNRIQETDAGALNALPDHAGKPRSAPVEFFVRPPEEIGSLLSAESTFQSFSRSWLLPYIGRILAGLILGGLIIWGMNWVAAQADPDTSGPEMIRRIGYGLAIALVAVQLWYSKFKATCSYVGELGAVRYTMKGLRPASSRADLLLFEQAAELIARQTRKYLHGVIYIGTSFDYSWNDSAGRRIYHLSSESITKVGDPRRFARAIENAWSKYFLNQAQRQLQEEGAIPFRIDNQRLIRVGPGFLEFQFGDGPVRLTTADIDTVSLKNGMFSFKHKDTKWYSREGKYSFSYGTMANAQVFLLALDQLMGYRWS